MSDFTPKGNKLEANQTNTNQPKCEHTSQIENLKEKLAHHNQSEHLDQFC
jgi:hypothetical protein